MKKTKLYQILEAFNSYELNRLDRFIRSPYFNKNPVWIHFFEILHKAIKSKKENPPPKQSVWSSLFPDMPYDDKRFRKITNDLLQLVMNFMSVEKHQSAPLEKAKDLLSLIRDKEITPLYNSSIKVSQRFTERHYYRNADYFYYRFYLDKTIFEMRNTLDNRLVKADSNETSLSQIMAHLDYFYLAEKLKYYSIILTWGKMYRREENILFMDEILQYVKENDFVSVPSIALYYYIVLLLKESENEENYFEYKKLLAGYLHLFPTEEQRELYEHLINFSIRRLNSGNKAFLFESFENYKLGLENGFLYVKGKLSPFLFKNIVTAGLRLQEYDWVKSFIEDYASKLTPDVQSSAVSYNLANLYFYKKQYAQVLRLLQEVEISDMYYNLGAKTLLMATYYETEEWDVLESFLHSFRVYLNRTKELPIKRKQAYSKLLTYTRKLARIIGRDNEALLNLYNDVKDDAFPSKNWLINKLEERLGTAFPEKDMPASNMISGNA